HTRRPSPPTHTAAIIAVPGSGTATKAVDGTSRISGSALLTRRSVCEGSFGSGTNNRPRGSKLVKFRSLRSDDTMAPLALYTRMSPSVRRPSVEPRTETNSSGPCPDRNPAGANAIWNGLGWPGPRGTVANGVTVPSAWTDTIWLLARPLTRSEPPTAPKPAGAKTAPPAPSGTEAPVAIVVLEPSGARAGTLPTSVWVL